MFFIKNTWFKNKKVDTKAADSKGESGNFWSNEEKLSNGKGLDSSITTDKLNPWIIAIVPKMCIIAVKTFALQIFKNHSSFKDVLASIFKGLLNCALLDIPGLCSKEW